MSLPAQPRQAKRWCFTLNNPVEADKAKLNALGSSCDYLVYGNEVGESGTPHLQGFVILSRSYRFNTVKDLLGERVHLEVARGNNKQAADYCKKDGDFTEFGTLPGQQGKRTDWDRYREYISDLGRLPSRRELASSFPSLYARYSKKCFEIAEAFLPSPSLTTSEPRFGWQANLAAKLETDPDPRKINFVVDPAGNSGKSWFCQYALSRWFDQTQIFRIGKRDDLAYAVDVSKSIFLLDVPRNQMIYLQYSFLESLKDRMIFSPKYESSFKLLGSVPHVVVFSNEEPDMNELTDDRYNIINI